MYKLLEQLETIKDKKEDHYFSCSQCQKAHINIDVNDYCEDYKSLMNELKAVQSLIDNYKIDID